MRYVTEKQLQEYADFSESQYTDFSAYRDCSYLAREVLRLRKLLKLATKKG